jgi:hypothetical protein
MVSYPPGWLVFYPRKRVVFWSITIIPHSGGVYLSLVSQGEPRRSRSPWAPGSPRQGIKEDYMSQNNIAINGKAYGNERVENLAHSAKDLASLLDKFNSYKEYPNFRESIDASTYTPLRDSKEDRFKIYEKMKEVVEASSHLEKNISQDNAQIEENFRMKQSYLGSEKELSNLIDASKDFSSLLDGYEKKDKEFKDMDEEWMPANPYKNFERKDVLDKMEKVVEASNHFEMKVKKEALANWNEYENRFRDYENKMNDFAFAKVVDQKKYPLLDIYQKQIQKTPKDQQDTLKQLKDKYTALEQANTPKELLRAGNQFDGNIRKELLQSTKMLLDSDHRFSNFREQREAFREVKEMREQSRATERKNDHGFER